MGCDGIYTVLNFIWIAILMGLRSVKSSNVGYHCLPLPNSKSSVWLRTEAEASGLCNQLFSIYSFIPIARILNANVIVGPVYSRHTFDDHWPFPPIKWSPFPFSHLVDWEYFQRYWQNEGIEVMEYLQYDLCKYDNSNRIYNVTRNPVFGAVTKDQFGKMIKDSKLPQPLPQNSIIQINAKIKFLTLYRFWEDYEMLYKVHHSLQPSPFLMKYINAIIAHLPSNYVSIHLRLEADYWGHSEERVLPEIKHAIDWVAKSNCFKHLKRHPNNSFIDAPPLYLSSGLFGHYENQEQKNHAKLTISYLNKYGFTQLHTRYNIMQLLHKITSKSIEMRDKFGDPYLYLKLLPEQLAYIDLYVSKAAQCFVPSHIGSSFSYMITRMKDLDKNIKLSYDDVHNKGSDEKGCYDHGISHDFKHWGF